MKSSSTTSTRITRTTPQQRFGEVCDAEAGDERRHAVFTLDLDLAAPALADQSGEREPDAVLAGVGRLGREPVVEHRRDDLVGDARAGVRRPRSRRVLASWRIRTLTHGCGRRAARHVRRARCRRGCPRRWRRRRQSPGSSRSSEVSSLIVELDPTLVGRASLGHEQRGDRAGRAPSVLTERSRDVAPLAHGIDVAHHLVELADLDQAADRVQLVGELVGLRAQQLGRASGTTRSPARGRRGRCGHASS